MQTITQATPHNIKILVASNLTRFLKSTFFVTRGTIVTTDGETIGLPLGLYEEVELDSGIE